MAETPKFDLPKILDESTKKLKEQFPEAHQLLAQAAANNMQTHLTSNQILVIVKALLDKIGFKSE